MLDYIKIKIHKSKNDFKRGCRTKELVHSSFFAKK